MLQGWLKVDIGLAQKLSRLKKLWPLAVYLVHATMSGQRSRIECTPAELRQELMDLGVCRTTANTMVKEYTSPITDTETGTVFCLAEIIDGVIYRKGYKKINATLGLEFRGFMRVGRASLKTRREWRKAIYEGISTISVSYEELDVPTIDSSREYRMRATGVSETTSKRYDREVFNGSMPRFTLSMLPNQSLVGGNPGVDPKRVRRVGDNLIAYEIAPLRYVREETAANAKFVRRGNTEYTPGEVGVYSIHGDHNARGNFCITGVQADVIAKTVASGKTVHLFVGTYTHPTYGKIGISYTYYGDGTGYSLDADEIISDVIARKVDELVAWRESKLCHNGEQLPYFG
jgi:hypothetical protein